VTHYNVPIYKKTEILIVGAGSAGVTAAITAGRLGKDVVLIEKNGFLGGIGTAVLDTINGIYTPDTGKKIAGGVIDDVLARLFETNAAIERPNTFGSGKVITYNPEVLKCIWDDMILESGAEVLLHSFCTDVVMDGDRIKGVIIDGKQGLLQIDADVVIDTSGDADVCCRAGVPFEKAGELEPAQTLTTTFRLANVDYERASEIPHALLIQMMKEANESGKYNLPREDGSIHITPVKGVMLAIMTRMDGYDPCDVRSITRAETEGRRQAREYIRFLVDKVPGYENAKLISLSHQVGVRESRRIYGEYRLTKEDVLSANKFEDSIGLCAAPIEDHHSGKDTHWEFLNEGKVYGIPYRTLVPKKVDSLLVAGRCFSATHTAHASCRSMGQTVTMGQAVGAAAALCVESKVSPRYLSVKLLQKKLSQMGAVLDID